MVATNDDIVTELKKIKKLLKGQYANQKDIDDALNQSE